MLTADPSVDFCCCRNLSVVVRFVAASSTNITQLATAVTELEAS
eukprot:COSAG01_NODE_2877_length_6927_cov_10.144259_3_plen_44_part_00